MIRAVHRTETGQGLCTLFGAFGYRGLTGGVIIVIVFILVRARSVVVDVQSVEHCEFHSHVQLQRDVHTRTAGLMSASGVFSVASGAEYASSSNLRGDMSVQFGKKSVTPDGLYDSSSDK